MKTVRLSIAAFSILAAASLVSAQSTSFDIELGYQNVDVNGNEDMFKTQINQDSGFVLRNLKINFIDPSGESSFADRLRIDASTYRLRFFYQEFKTFSALPAFANPLLDEGVVPGQHTWDRTRNVLDIQLELPLWRTITPIVGYRWNRYDGPGQTTYSVGNDEFRIASDLEQTESEFYLGLNFATKAVFGTFIQGWRTFDGTDRQGLAPGEGVGNNPGTSLGQEVELDSFDRTTRSTADTPVTTFHVTARASDHVRLIASYVKADSEGETSLDEMLSGSLVSFQLSRFFQGLDQTIESRTENPYSRGEARFEFDLSDKAGLKVGYQIRERELEGWAMVSSLFMDTLNFGGFDPRDIQSPQPRRLLGLGRLRGQQPEPRRLAGHLADRAAGRSGGQLRPADQHLRARGNARSRQREVYSRPRRTGSRRRHYADRFQRSHPRSRSCRLVHRPPLQGPADGRVDQLR
jgi:hypothetical protein